MMLSLDDFCDVGAYLVAQFLVVEGQLANLTLSQLKICELLQLLLVEAPDGPKQRPQAHVAVVVLLKLFLFMLEVNASLARSCWFSTGQLFTLHLFMLETGLSLV
jgi:hypothetical protein